MTNELAPRGFGGGWVPADVEAAAYSVLDWIEERERGGGAGRQEFWEGKSGGNWNSMVMEEIDNMEVYGMVLETGVGWFGRD